jgi:MoxR-like ATPase
MATAEQGQRYDLPHATLAASQKAFIEAARVGRCCVFAGPAGCGKTTAVSAAASVLQGENPSSKTGDRFVKPSKVVKLFLFPGPNIDDGLSNDTQVFLFSDRPMAIQREPVSPCQR